MFRNQNIGARDGVWVVEDLDMGAKGDVRVEDLECGEEAEPRGEDCEMIIVHVELDEVREAVKIAREVGDVVVADQALLEPREV